VVTREDRAELLKTYLLELTEKISAPQDKDKLMTAWSEFLDDAIVGRNTRKVLGEEMFLHILYSARFRTQKKDTT
jgi:hypothetical protein